MEDLMYSICCQNCSEECPIIVRPSSTLEELDPRPCPRCGKVPTEDTLKMYLEIQQKVAENLDRFDIAQGEPENCIK